MSDLPRNLCARCLVRDACGVFATMRDLATRGFVGVIVACGSNRALEEIHGPARPHE